MYKLTWKDWVTPSGASRSRLRASVRRISETDCGLLLTGWATPRSEISSDTPETHESRQARVVAKHGRRMGTPIEVQAALAGWPTPTTGNATGSQSFEGLSATGKTPDGRKVAVALPHVATMAGWNTPRATDGTNGGPNQAGGALPADAAVSGWPTPMAGTPARNGNNEAGNSDSSRKTTDLCKTDGPARLTVSGEMLIGSSAGMESGGRLNPCLSRWLMGYPREWGYCGDTAMQSIRKPRKSSLKATYKAKALALMGVEP